MDKISTEISKFILSQVENHPSDIVSLVSKKFGFSRQRAHIYMAREVRAGRIIKTGLTRHTRYFLVGGKHIEFNLELIENLDEYNVWSKYVKPMLLRYPENIQGICSYGFTEILNNAIHHSEGTTIFVDININDNNLDIIILDNGVGLFEKIQKAMGLESAREAILHLSKGKFTTDPENHSGEGIFFTSRTFDRFSIFSSDMLYTFENRDWFLSSEKRESFGDGTSIKMRLSLKSTKTVKGVMDLYSNLEIGFGKTIVAVALSADPGDPHVSRSQAKRLLVGLEKFKEVLLDFKGVESVGQAFVDEVFRVYKKEHPNIIITYINASSIVDAMIKRGLSTEN